MKGRFTLDIEAFTRKAGTRVDDVVKKIGLDLFARVVLRTPVDTGRARGNWQMTIGTPSAVARAVIDKSGAKTIEEAQAVLQTFKAGPMLFIRNNLPYAVPLEYGWSKQAPAGMVRVTVAEFQALAANAAQAAQRDDPLARY